MTADELIEAGNLEGAIAALEELLRHRPRDPAARASLFALACLSGQWDRAPRLLDALEKLREPGAPLPLDPERYRAILAAEMARQRYFTEGASPQTLGTPNTAVKLTLLLHRLVAAGQSAQAASLLDEYEEGRQSLCGRYGGEPFDDFRDVEDWMSPVLEVLAPEGYFWVGWDEVQFLDVAPPRSLLDLLWAPARLGLTSRVLGAVVVPALYPETWRHADALVKLGRRSEWTDVGAGLVRGAGAKVYQVGAQTKGLLELQDVSFETRSEVGP